MEQDIRMDIFNEVQRTLLGPMGGEEEQLDKNPLDFYTVGVLFPAVISGVEYGDDTPDLGASVDDQNGENKKNAEEEHEQADVNDQEVEYYSGRRRSRSTKESASGEEDSLELSTKFRPSAAGLSVLVRKGSHLHLGVSFATYHAITVERENTAREGGSSRLRVFSRQPFLAEFDYSQNGPNVEDRFLYECRGRVETIILSDACRLSIVTRPYPHATDFEIKTFTLINNVRAASFKDQKRPLDCIFQPCIKLICPSGFSPFEDLSSFRNMGEEDINLKLLYRNYKTYGLGHGISVNWSTTGDLTDLVQTEVLPVEKVNGVDMNPPAYHGKEILFMKKLGGQALHPSYDWKVVRAELREFCMSYGSWILSQQQAAESEHPPLRRELLEQVESNLGKCQELLGRMEEGITLLDQNPDALKAFQDANQAMFVQRVMADFSRHRRIKKRVQHDSEVFDDALPDYSAIPYDAGSGELWEDGRLSPDNASRKGTLARWRPFQLAFLLSQIKGIIDPSSEDRDTVDLIWFPTGGGKTEAYLGLTAFTIFYRRLSAKSVSGNPNDGAGVSVLMRYTLRLLNKQQFERAGILVCACELIRRKEILNYGQTRISNGIWMGSSMTPNTIEIQIENYATYIRSIDKGQTINPWIISPPVLSCPCCGNRLVKEQVSNKVTGRWGYFQRLHLKGKATGPFHIACTNTRCDFHVTAKTLPQREGFTLPIYEVDKLIYQQRPSLLFSTVDKYVQLAWNSDCFTLFNLDFSAGTIARRHPAPSLIIQDELHLISSALGTIYGVYEIAIERLCVEAGGLLPKIIGASATVRNARQQCSRLYARSHFMQFPPPGISADDFLFCQENQRGGQDQQDVCRIYGSRYHNQYRADTPDIGITRAHTGTSR
ncbi:hypothetical protein [Pedobacter agri]|uniref:hypothetical protein n=1 Tax=Pedobacter agri TaxID=454586 RepID=UPI00031C06A8|nr:hypothetical protein [Pedobacter agri]